MKVLLTLSLLANVALGYLYVELKSLPPLERIVVQEKKVFVPAKSNQSGPQSFSQKKPNDTETSSPISPEYREYEAASMETDEKKNEVLEDLGITEEMVQKKEKLTNKFFKDYEKLVGKNSHGLNIDFATRRRLIDLEEKLHKDYEQIYGKERWNKYKKFVDKNNNRVLKDYNESGGSEGVMLNY